MADLIILGGHQFNTLIADTLEEQAKGLMYKKWPPPVMSFPYKTAEIRKFWMKNTISPLDIIFCRSGKIVGIYKGEPLSTMSVGPNEPVDLVIELPHGKAKKIGIAIGDDVELLRGLRGLAKKFEKRLHTKKS